MGQLLKKRIIYLDQPVSVAACAAVAGRMEGLGPLAERFDEIEPDSFFGAKTWEQAESRMQQRSLHRALQKGRLEPEEIDLLFAGDLLNQCVATSFALRDFPVSLCGVYGACSTMGEALLLAGMALDGGFARTAGAMASSHFCTAERQYRMPMPYGSQRAPTAQWTATAAGCCLLHTGGTGPFLRGGIVGRVTDLGITDSANMGAAMAPAACDTLCAFFRCSGTRPEDYDRIITGDLGALGGELLQELTAQEGYILGDRYTDCGLLLYDREAQDMHAGGSGAGCCAGVLCAYLLPEMREKKWRRLLFAPTGALLSPTTGFQGESIPGICHAVVFTSEWEEQI